MASILNPLPEALQDACPYKILGVEFPSIQTDSPSLSHINSQWTTIYAHLLDPSGLDFVINQVSSKVLSTLYRKSALKAHPDKNRGRENEAQEQFVRVNLAFVFLSSKENREKFHTFIKSIRAQIELDSKNKARLTEKAKERLKFKEKLLEREQKFAQESTSLKHQYKGSSSLDSIKQKNLRLLQEHHDSIYERKILFRANQNDIAVDESTECILERSAYIEWDETKVISPGALGRFFAQYHAVELCYYNPSHDACISFASKERALEAVLGIYKMQKKKNDIPNDTSSQHLDCDLHWQDFRISLAEKKQNYLSKLLFGENSATDFGPYLSDFASALLEASSFRGTRFSRGTDNVLGFDSIKPKMDSSTAKFFGDYFKQSISQNVPDSSNKRTSDVMHNFGSGKTLEEIEALTFEALKKRQMGKKTE